MLFKGKRSTFKRVRLKRPTVFYQPGFDAAPYGFNTQAETTEQNLVHIAQHLLACRTDPYYGVFLANVDTLKPYLDLYPEERAWIVRLAQQERVAIGAAYVPPMESFIGGEALVRAIVYGNVWAKTATGVAPKVFLNGESDAHASQLPQILAQCGVKAMLAPNRSRQGQGQSPGLFVWSAPNGDWIYLKRLEILPASLTLPERLERSLDAIQSEYPQSQAAVMLDSLDEPAPQPALVGRGREWGANDPALVCTGAAAEKFFSYIDNQVANKKIELEWMPADWPPESYGRSAARGDLKLASRLTENRLYEAEVWTTFAAVMGRPVSFHGIEFAWRQLLFAQSKQGVAFGGSELVFADCLDALHQALDAATAARNGSLRLIAARVDTQPKQSALSMLLFNSLPWRQEGLVRCTVDVTTDFSPFSLTDAEGEPIPFEIEKVDSDAEDHPTHAHLIWVQSQMPATGYVGVRRTPAHDVQAPYLKRAQRQTWVENEFFRVEIDPDRGGGIVSLFDKDSGKEWINQEHSHPGNVLLTLPIDEPENPRDGFVLRSGIEAAMDPTPAFDYYEGPVSRRLLVRGAGPGSCRRIQEIKLYDGLPYIDCVTLLVDYRGRESRLDDPTAPYRDMYLAAFPLNHPGAAPVLDDRFYAKAGRSGLVSLQNARPTEWNERGLNLQSSERWLDISWTFLIRFMDSGEEIASLAVGPSELVTPDKKYRAAGDALMKHLSRHGAPSQPGQALQTENRNAAPSCIFSIGLREENDYTHHLLSRNADAADYFTRNLEQFGSVFLAVEDAEIGTPANPVKVFILAGQTSALVEQIVEDMGHNTVSHRWECPASACFISGLTPIDDAGFAVFQTGSPLSTYMADGVLGLSLLQTAPYPRAQTGWPVDFADRKSHVFSYRLYPHAGDWRLAETPRRAMEYHHEITTLPVEPHHGDMAPQHSFLSVEPPNMILSAIKPAGFSEWKCAEKPSPISSVVLRAYEAHGEESNVWIEAKTPLRNVKAVTLLEEPLAEKRELFREDQFVRGLAHANEIVSYQFDFKTEPSPPAIESDAPPLVTHTRYWRQNSGAAPMGMTPVAISLRGQIRLDGRYRNNTVHHLDLVTVNNSPDRTVQGEVEISAPAGWRVIPSKVGYRLQGGGYQITPLHLILDGVKKEGAVIARTRCGAISVEDLIHIGPAPEFDLSMTLTREGFNVNLQHAYPFDVSGDVRVISPLEAWHPELSGEASLTSITPYHQPFTAPPNESVALSFPVSEPPNRYGVASNHHWMIIKLTAHHCIRYYHIRLDGRKSEGLGKVLAPPYFAPDQSYS